MSARAIFRPFTKNTPGNYTIVFYGGASAAVLIFFIQDNLIAYICGTKSIFNSLTWRARCWLSNLSRPPELCPRFDPVGDTQLETNIQIYIYFCPNRSRYPLPLQLLQNLGKVDRTADEIFDEHLTNFNRQQNNAARLQKEFNNYIRCVRGEFTAVTFKRRLQAFELIFGFCLHFFHAQRCKRHRNRWWKPFRMCTKRIGRAPRHWLPRPSRSTHYGKIFRIN